MITTNRKSLGASILILCISAAGCFFLLRTPSYVNLLEKQNVINDVSYFFPLRIVGFTGGNSPKLEVNIEEQLIPSQLDLGWGGGVAFPSETVHNLRNKTFIGRYSSSGLRGKIYESIVYEVPHIHLGKVRISPMRIEEEKLEFLKDSILKKAKKEIPENKQGRIGWYVFKPFNVLLDCEHSAIILCDSLDTLKQQGFQINSFVEASLVLDRDYIEFEVMTDAGSLRCLLDSGATLNLLNKNLESENQDHRIIKFNDPKQSLTFNPENEDLLVFNSEDWWDSKTLQINGNEFGPVTFTKMKSPLDFDAILGMEFIEDHLIFIDFGNKKIYFSKLPEDRSLLIRAYDFALDKIK